jgi:hypothetical protein
MVPLILSLSIPSPTKTALRFEMNGKYTIISHILHVLESYLLVIDLSQNGT